MGSISKYEKLHFLISISKNRLPKNADYATAVQYWYGKSIYKDFYEVAIRIAFTTLARTVRGIQNSKLNFATSAESRHLILNFIFGEKQKDLVNDEH